MSKKRVVLGDVGDASASEVAVLAQVRPQKLSRVLQAIARSVPGKTLPEEVPEEEDRGPEDTGMVGRLKMSMYGTGDAAATCAVEHTSA